MRWRATLGFVASERGLSAAPMSMSAETALLTREGLPAIDDEHPLDFETPGRARLLNVARLASAFNQARARPAAQHAERSASMRRRLADALPRFTPNEASYTLSRMIETALLTTDDPNDPVLPALLDAFGPQPPDVATVQLLLFVPQSLSDEFLQAAAASDTEAVAEIASFVSEAMRRMQQQRDGQAAPPIDRDDHAGTPGS